MLANLLIMSHRCIIVARVAIEFDVELNCFGLVCQGFVFKEDRVSRLMKDMISSVHYLHQKGIVHR